MIIKENDKEFEQFQALLKDIGYDKIPENPSKCWICESYDLFQNHIKSRYKLTPDELAILSKYVCVEKYYWMSVTMFPSLYLTYNTGNGFKDYFKLNNNEKEDFKKQVQNMAQAVYENQKALGLSLDEDYMEIGNNMVAKLLEIDQRREQQPLKDAESNDLKESEESMEK